MADTLSDEEKKDHWERIHSTDTEKQFREFVFDQLSFHSGESILSVGCGPGFETADLAESIGNKGSVTGIDINEKVLAAARDRCTSFPQVSFVQGDITNLPIADESYDLVTAKQVLSEVSEPKSALDELFRVVTPDGRVAVTGGDRRSHVKHTPTDRLQHADEIFRSQMSEHQLGTRLISLLPEAGFSVEDVIPRAKFQTEITDQVDRGIEIQRGLLKSSDVFDDSEIDAWERDLRELDEKGQFLSCGVAFLYVARKPV